MKRSPIIAIILGFGLFFLSSYLAKGLMNFVPGEIIWLEQVLMKAILIVVSFASIALLLKIPWSDAGFQKPNQKLKKRPIILGGMLLGALATAFVFFSPAQGIPLVKSLNLLEFLLVIVIWSSLAEEIFIRGFIQSYLKPFEEQKVKLFSFSCSVPVCISAFVFAGIHLSLLFAGIDYYTVCITVALTFLLGLLAGIYREKYESIVPALITHMSFNVGGIICGIIIAIMYKIITGELPPQ